jgi:hypothetical protein
LQEKKKAIIPKNSIFFIQSYLFVTCQSAFTFIAAFPPNTS